MGKEKYRVAQWITGHTGRIQLKNIIEHPDMELAACYVHSEEKVGKDAGEIAGIRPVGVKATNRIEDVLAARPDCIMYSPLTGMSNIDELCLFLKNGINVVTIVTEFSFHYPKELPADVREKLEAACTEGKASLFATGVSPGFVQENLLMAVLGQMRRIDSISIYEFGDMVVREDSPEMIAMMFGQAPEVMAMAESQVSYGQLIGFGPTLKMVMDSVGLPLYEVTCKTTFPTAKETFTLAKTVIEKGKVAAYQGVVSGWKDGKELIRFCYNWYATRKLDGEILPMRDGGWRIEVDGDVPHTLDIYYERDVKKYMAIQPGYNGNMAVNSIIPTILAEPGIRTLVDMPLIVPKF